MKGAIWSAYADVDMTKPCPRCGAAPNTWCTNEITGRVRRIPCKARPTARPTTTVADDQGVHTPVDYTEPRHPKQEGPQ